MKKWKWFLVIVLVLFLAIGGTALYFFKFKTYDVADEKVDAVLEENFELELPDGTVVVVDKDGNIVEEKAATTVTELPVGATVNEDGTTVTLPDGQVIANPTTLPAGAKVSETGVAQLVTGETATIEYVTPQATTPENETAAANGSTNGTTGTTNNGSTDAATNGSATNGNATSNNGAVTNNGSTATDDTANNGNTAGEGTTSNNGSTPPATNGKPTVSDIKNKYAGSFASLESQASAKLNGLLGTAKSEYAQSQASGEGVSYAYFYQKYYGAAQSLEANTDSAFNALLSVVKSDLKQNGYDESYANSFVSDYEAAKKAREASILDKLK
ncbi:MAG: hypothetical protein KIG60_08150 [Caryophanon sp.]|nr:hypothetical protein [Caryophanon sp.]